MPQRGIQSLFLDDHPRRRLLSLSVAGCSHISGKGLQALSKACSKSMRQLNISRTMVSSLQLLTKWVSLPVCYRLRVALSPYRGSHILQVAPHVTISDCRCHWP